MRREKQAWYVFKCLPKLLRGLLAPLPLLSGGARIVTLPSAFLGLPAQFIHWVATPSETHPGKFDKKPIGPEGYLCNPVDPKSWSSAGALDSATPPDWGDGGGVGFVFTAADPYFFLDIDHCFDDAGQATPLAAMLCAQFAGAYLELSHSGKGLHIIGQGVCPPHGCKDNANGLELYTELRFCALTGLQAVGDPRADCSALLPWLVGAYFPEPAAKAEGIDWTTEPDPAWVGPESDEELIAAMLRAKVSAAAAFGGRATVRELWEADEDALAKYYPDPGGKQRAYGESEADMALATHLAFWTGKNCERMETLMRLSGLVRDKWDAPGHATYLSRTILGAVALTVNVYQARGKAKLDAAGRPTTSVAAPLPESASGAVEQRAGYQLMTVDQQAEHFKGCVYVRNMDRIFTPDGDLLKASQFRATYGGFQFALDGINEQRTKSASEAFLESQVLRHPWAHGAWFRPELESGALFGQEGRRYVNTYVPALVASVEGDVSPFLHLVDKLLPVETDRAIMLAYLAAAVQYTGEKFQWAPVLQGVPGNGKTFLFEAVAAAVGERYTHKPKARDLGNVFNAWLANKLWIIVEEIYVPGRRDVTEALLEMVTNRRIEVQPKGVDQAMGDNRANFGFCTNHKDGIQKDSKDRRYAPFFTPHQEAIDIVNDGMGGQYFPQLYRWFRAGGNAHITYWLQNYAIPDALNPATECQRAPVTSSTTEALAVGLGRVEQEILEAVAEGRRGFCHPWISSMALDVLLTSTRTRSVSRNKRKELLANLGYVAHPGLPDGRVTSALVTENGRPRLYVKAGHLATQLVGPSIIADRYENDQSCPNLPELAPTFGQRQPL